MKTEPGSPPTCVTPPLPRSPSTSDVNKYPSLKKKILGPKMVDADHPHAESPTTSSKENAGNSTLGNKYTSTFASTTDLAAAAAFATGLQPSKRKREFDEPFGPRRRQTSRRRGPTTARTALSPPSPTSPTPKPKPRTPKASEKTPKSRTTENRRRRRMRRSPGASTPSSTAPPCERAARDGPWTSRTRATGAPPRIRCTTTIPGSCPRAEPCTRSLEQRLCHTGSSAVFRSRA